MRFPSRILTAAWAVAAGLAGAPAAAQDYPVKPIRIVVPAPPGGSVDMVARLLGQSLSDEFRQPVLIDNRPGASGNIGMEHVAKSPKDGYTLLLSSFSVAVNAQLFEHLSFDPAKDLAPILRVVDQPNVLVVNSDRVAATTLKDLVAHLKANPGRISVGTTGIGNPQDFSARQFMVATGTEMLPVAYKGSAPALVDLVGGHIDLMFDTSPTAVPYVKGGKLKALAVTSDQRLASLPDVPTVDEAGVPGYKSVFWMGLFAPAGTPEPALRKIHAASLKALSLPSVRKEIGAMSITPAGGSPEEFRAFLQREAAFYGKLIKDLGIPKQ